MNVLPWAGFVADFPDDQIEAGGDIQVYGGRNVAVALGKIFAGLGCSRVSEPWSAGEVGWEFDFYYGDRKNFWCRVQSFHPVFWLLFEDRSISDGQAYVELWRKFGSALERDPRFRRILWRTFKNGPPDWDEVEAASDPPALSFDEEFPPTKINARARRTSIWPYIIGVWLTMSGIGLPLDVLGGHNIWHQIRYFIAGIILLTVGVFFLFIAINQNREAPWPFRQRPES
jgi:hypothetical protein